MNYVIKEENFFRAAKEIAEKRKKDLRTIVIKCSSPAAEQLKVLLERLQLFGNLGHTATIRTDPEFKEDYKDFGFDGDGPSRIYSITVKKGRE